MHCNYDVIQHNEKTVDPLREGVSLAHS